MSEEIVMLTPRQIAERYGISRSMVHELCTSPDESKRLPSLKIPGRKGRLGKRLVRKVDLEAWLKRFEAQPAN